MGAPIPPVFAFGIALLILLSIVLLGVGVVGAVYAFITLWRGGNDG